MATKRVRLVFEVETHDSAVPESDAADILLARLNRDIPVDEVFKEIKILRPFVRREGVTYGRRRGTKFVKVD